MLSLPHLGPGAPPDDRDTPRGRGPVLLLGGAACIDPAAHNVEVTCGHVGLLVDRAARHALATALADTATASDTTAGATVPAAPRQKANVPAAA